MVLSESEVRTNSLTELHKNINYKPFVNMINKANFDHVCCLSFSFLDSNFSWISKNIVIQTS